MARTLDLGPTAVRRLLAGSAIALLFGLVMLLGTSGSAAASVWTDQPVYSPGSTVTISGDNENFAGYEAGEQVVVEVTEPGGTQKSCEATADFSGAWSCQVTLASDSSAIGSYSYIAVGQKSNTIESGSFTDSNCPDAESLSSHTKTDPEIKASFTTSGGVATYSFTSPNKNPSKGIPGMLEYCVYTEPQPAEPPDGNSVHALYGDWTVTEGGKHGYFDFERKGGSGDNLPFDGTTQTMGTATWSSGKVPTKQIILCHINDPGNSPADSFVRCLETGGEGIDPTASKTATPAFNRTYKWSIEKAVDKTEVKTAGGPASFKYTVSVKHDAGSDSGWKVSGAISVSNTNSAAVSGVEVTDAINDPNASCSVTGGTNATLPAESVTAFAYSCTYSSAPETSSETNTATVKWDMQTLSNGATLKASSATGKAPVDWSSTSPTIIDGSVVVTDTLAGSLGTVSYTDASPKKFEYAHEFTGDPAGTCTTHENIAKFKASDSGSEGSASQSVKHCVGADLTVSKSASPSFTRTYKWGITKSVNKTEITTSGGPATFNYTVSVSHDSGTDSGWQVSGTITVSNPNDWQAVTLSGVEDAINNGGNCSITSGNPTGSVAASSSVKLGYTCSYSSAPSPAAFTNKATASWDKTAASTPDGTASGEATGEFASPTVVDGSVVVTDTVAGSLGTVSYTDVSPKKFEYAHEFTGDPVGKCTTHENTATFKTSTTSTEGAASQSVKVCVEEPCTKIVGAGHYGPKSPNGETVDDNLTINPGYTGKEEFRYVWEVSPGVHKAVGLQKVIWLKCVKHGTEAVFSGHGIATVGGVKGYEVTFTFTQKEGKTYLVVVLEKAGKVLQEWHDEPLSIIGTNKEIIS